MIVLVFANYIQCFGHNIIPVIVYFISNVLLVLFGTAYGGTIAQFSGYNAATGIFAGVSIGSIIAVLILPVFVGIINLMNGCKDHLWMFPKNFGVPASDEISADIDTQKEVRADLRGRKCQWQYGNQNDHGGSQRSDLYHDVQSQQSADQNSKAAC